MAKFKAGDKVELIPGKDLVYKRAVAHSRGTVTRTREDDDGFEQVYIVWDREHWRYSGEQDGWTFAEHFRPVDDVEILTAEEFDIPHAIPSQDDEEVVTNYLDTLMVACDKAAESDGFLFVMLKRDEHGRIHFEVLGASTDDELGAVSTSEVFRFLESEMRRRGQ